MSTETITEHYWSRPRELDLTRFNEFINHARRICEASPYAIRNDGGEGEPVLTSELLAINGDEANEDHGEAFIIERVIASDVEVDEEGQYHDYCNCYGRPYDTVVRAILIALARDFPEARIWSQTDARGWVRAHHLYAQALLGRGLTETDRDRYFAHFKAGGELTADLLTVEDIQHP